MALYEITLLNGFTLSVDGQTLAAPASTQRMIAFLALRGRCGRSRLAGSLWEDTTQLRALACLRTALWRANQAAPGLIDYGQDFISLAHDVDVDVTSLVKVGHAVMEGLRIVPTETLGLQSLEADLLPDWPDEWLVVDRERLRQLRLHVLEALATGLADKGMFGLAMEAGIVALHADPLRESAHRVIIRIHLAEGNVAEALHAFEQCEAVLNRELGVGPSDQTLSLLSAIHDMCPGRGIVRGRISSKVLGDDGVTGA